MRFSHAIPWVVLVLVAAGVTMARVQVGSPQALTDTAYGRVFMAKLALLALLFLAAAWNRWRLTRPVMAGNVDAIRRFRRSVKVELLLVVAIFGVVALWRFTPPSRALAEAEAARIVATADPQMVHVESGDTMAMLWVDPARRGANEVEISLYSMEADPIPAQEVTLIMASKAAGIEPVRRKAVPGEEEGSWAIPGLTLPVSGLWQFTVEALISDFEMTKYSGEVEIAH